MFATTDIIENESDENHDNGDVNYSLAVNFVESFGAKRCLRVFSNNYRTEKSKDSETIPEVIESASELTNQEAPVDSDTDARNGKVSMTCDRPINHT